MLFLYFEENLFFFFFSPHEIVLFFLFTIPFRVLPVFSVKKMASTPEQVVCTPTFVFPTAFPGEYLFYIKKF